eukprot:842521-Amphidinium_carterae.1
MQLTLHVGAAGDRWLMRICQQRAGTESSCHKILELYVGHATHHKWSNRSRRSIVHVQCARSGRRSAHASAVAYKQGVNGGTPCAQIVAVGIRSY